MSTIVNTDVCDYYDRLSLGPLWDIVPTLFPKTYITDHLLIVMYILILGWSAYKWYQKGVSYRLAILMLSPALVVSVIHFTPILLGLPMLTLAVQYLQTRPKISAVLVSIASVLTIHPLLGYFLIFFTKNKKEFGITALVATIILLLLPLTVMSMDALWVSYKGWITGFRSIPTVAELPNEFSVIHLIRKYEILPPWLLRLLVINLFHIQLLPCLKARKLETPQSLLPLFSGSIILFIGLFSGMNTLYTSVISMSGTVIWMLFGNLSEKTKYTLGGVTLGLSYTGITLGLFASDTNLVSELLVLLPMSIVWLLNVLEIWKYIYKNKAKNV